MAVIDDKQRPVQQAGDQNNLNRGAQDDGMDIDVNSTNSEVDVIPRVTPPSAQEQAEEIAKLMEENSQVGADQVWYVISAKWLRSFRIYTQLDDNYRVDPTAQRASDSPSPIDNDVLALTVINVSEPKQDPFTTKLRKNILDRMDYELIPQLAAEKLYSWYGGGPVIARNTISDGRHYNVELHPYFVEVALCGKSSSTDMTKNSLRFREISVSKKMLMKDLKKKIKNLFKLTTADNELRLFSAFNGSPYQLYDSEELTKEVEEVIDRPKGQQLILEEKSASGWRIKTDEEDTAPITAKSTGNAVYSIADKKTYNDRYGSGGSSSSYSNANNGDNVSSEPGVCGLQNLGNTCFMNSALQCLTKTPVIRDYFVSGDYANEINRDNPLGMGGKIAEAFGNLMKDGFSGRHSYISPREFKHIIGKFAPQFSGYQQQDSQELIAYLLDGLHEDLNRIKKKPATEQVESKGRPDNIVADEAWSVHKLRNDSVIVDKFQGQLKSELVCPDCGNVSITFDPFMYLSLPLPVERNRYIDVTIYFYGNRRAPLKCQVSVNKRGTVDELRKAVADIAGITKVQNVAIVEIFSNKVYRYFADNMDIKAILDNDVIFAFEMSDNIDYDPSIHTTYSSYDNTNLPYAAARMATVIKEEHRSAYSNTTTVSTRTAYITHPFVISFDKKQTTNKALYDTCFEYLKPYLRSDEVERLGLKLDDPESFLYKGPTEKQKLRMEAERERQRKKREKEERERRRMYNRYYHHNSSDSDKMSDEDKEEDEAQQPPDEEEEEEDEKFILFTLRFEDNSSYAKLDSFEDVLPYNDQVVEAPKDKYYHYSSNEKKSIIMFVNPIIMDNLIDQQKLKEVELHDSIKPTTGSSSSGEKGVSLDSCLELFTQREKLSSNDTWYCPECKKHVEATKKFDLWRLPEVLVVHLKRFQYNRYSRDKLETFIDYPISGLDLGPHIQHNVQGNTHRIYDLFAVSNHYGGLGGGHYTAYAKIQRKNQWYKFDDSYTSPVSEESVKASSGYVLFYLARNENTNNTNTKMDE